MKERLAAERRPYVAIALARALGIIGLLAAAITGCTMIFSSMGCTKLPIAPDGTKSDPGEACSTVAKGRDAVAAGPYAMAIGDGSPARGLVAAGDGRPAQDNSYAGGYFVLRATGYEFVVLDTGPSAQREN